MAIFKVFTLSIKNTVRLKRFKLNVPEEFVFPHIAALFGTLTSVWLRQRSTTLHEKTSPSGAKQFLKSKFLLRQGKKASNAVTHCEALGRSIGGNLPLKTALSSNLFSLHDTTFQRGGKDFVQIFKDFVKSIDFCSVFGVI